MVTDIFRFKQKYYFTLQNDLSHESVFSLRFGQIGSRTDWNMLCVFSTMYTVLFGMGFSLSRQTLTFLRLRRNYGILKFKSLIYIVCYQNKMFSNRSNVFRGVCCSWVQCELCGHGPQNRQSYGDWWRGQKGQLVDSRKTKLYYG